MRPLRDLDVDELRSRGSLKWAQHGPDVLPLWVAEMDAAPAPAILERLAGVVARGDLGYPLDGGFAEHFADFAEDRWGWRPGPAAPVADVMTGVVEALRLVSEPGDPIIVTPPVYPPFHDAVELVGGRPVHVPLGSHWRLDLDALAETFAEHAGRCTALLCNPHNPTGIAPTREELTAVAQLAGEHGVRVVVDEIHAPLADPTTFTPYLSLPGTDDALVATSASKGWNIATLKAGLLLAGADAARDLASLPVLLSHGASAMGIWGQVAAWRDSREWLEDVRTDLAENRDLLADLVDDHLPDAILVAGDATYLAWLDLGAYPWGDDPATSLIDTARVALGSGPPFGNGEGFARVNYATSPEILTEAFERIGRVAAS